MNSYPELPKPGTLAARIVRLMRAHPNRLFSPTELARELNEQPNSVRKTLSRLLDADHGAAPIVRVKRGQYRAFRDAEQVEAIEPAKPKVHGILLTFKTPRNAPWSPQRAPQANWGSLSADVTWHMDDATGTWGTTLEWRGRALKVQVFKTGTLQVGCKAGDAPLEPTDLETLLSKLDGWFYGLGLSWEPSDVRVSSIEMNRDFESLSLRGASAVKVKNLLSSWWQVYERHDGRTRAELRLDDPDLTLGEVSNLLETWSAVARDPGAAKTYRENAGRADELRRVDGEGGDDEDRYGMEVV